MTSNSLGERSRCRSSRSKNQVSSACGRRTERVGPIEPEPLGRDTYARAPSARGVGIVLVLVTVHDVAVRVMLVFMVVIVMIVAVLVLRPVEMLVLVLVIVVAIRFERALFSHFGFFGSQCPTHSVFAPAG